MSIELTSTAFQQGATIPKPYTGNGVDQSPPLRWSEPPPGTKSIALICDDPDAPRDTWVHWVLYNLPPQTRELEEGVPTTETLANGAKQGEERLRGHRLRRSCPAQGQAAPLLLQAVCPGCGRGPAARSKQGSTDCRHEGAHFGRGATHGHLRAIAPWADGEADEVACPWLDHSLGAISS
jgi:Raf kinase inhibitor-like YbhB/YbcL family protein